MAQPSSCALLLLLFLIHVSSIVIEVIFVMKRHVGLFLTASTDPNGHRDRLIRAPKRPRATASQHEPRFRTQTKGVTKCRCICDGVLLGWSLDRDMLCKRTGMHWMGFDLQNSNEHYVLHGIEH